MERININNNNFLTGYHTQEYREDSELLFPIKCTMNNAWLGRGYYFWADIEFAKYWGEDFKVGVRKNGFYNIYSANLEIENCINAVFDEKHYYFFRNCIEKAIEYFKSNSINVNLEQVHEFLLNKFWKENGITGILYDDLPINPNYKPDRKYSVIEYRENNRTKHMYYKKRIQIVVFNDENIHNFACYLEKQC